MKLLGAKRALLLPANPSLSRTIRDGNYYIQGQPIHQTGFAKDPEFAIQRSEIVEMLHAIPSDQVTVLHQDATLPTAGIIVGEAVSTDDIAVWAARIEPTTALIGAGDFFEAILKQTYSFDHRASTPTLHQPYLYISGTAFSSAQQWVKSIYAQTDLVHYLSYNLLHGVPDSNWFDHIGQSLQKIRKQSLPSKPMLFKTLILLHCNCAQEWP